VKQSLKALLSLVALGLTVSSPLAVAQDDPAPTTQRQKGEKGEKGGRKAGGRGGMMASPEQRIAQIDKAVGGLTAEQKTKIQAIYARTAEEMRALAENSAGNRNEGTRKEGAEILKSTRAQVAAVLTAEQRKKFEDMPEPARGPGMAKGPGRKRDKNQ
jgi:Spy/CpxP family protein refolding chaperone